MVYLDANVIIRFVEGDVASREPIQRRLAGESSIMTSQLSRLECRCKPMVEKNSSLLALYDLFFSGHDLRVIELDQRVIDVATEIRGQFKLKSPDAIHLAAAVVSGASAFLTGDERLARCDRVAVELI